MIRPRRVVMTVTALGAAHAFLGALTAAPAAAHGVPDNAAAHGALENAAAHGALENPVSRAAACGPEGGDDATSEACEAAVARSSPNALDAWDTLRVPGVGGRDREVIPDGRLCSAGLPRFRGLDLPRGDWPATSLPAGVAYDFAYRATIPHKGTFRLYVTKDGYRPTRPLTWSSLEPEPFLEVTDPKLTGGAYRMKGKLPSGKTGRHLIYTVWQNSDTPDTYYSCSDVVFATTGGAGTDDRTSGADAGDQDGGAAAGDRESGAGTEAPRAVAAEPRDRAEENAMSGTSATTLVAGGAVALLLCAGAVVALARRADRRAR